MPGWGNLGQTRLPPPESSDLNCALFSRIASKEGVVHLLCHPDAWDSRLDEIYEGFALDVCSGDL
ncbi:hypothetical protein M413DRAFT_438881, partial [Hebeloma cylindrosporum]